MTGHDELLEVVDLSGKVVRLACRSELHGRPDLIHRVVHVLVFNAKGNLLLQKRSMTKDIAPGKWDTSVGGHINPGEEVFAAAHRELGEELGASGLNLQFLYRYLYRNHVESELVHTFICQYEGPFSANRQEIDEVRFWEMKEILAFVGKKIFSGNFEAEIRQFAEHDHISENLPDFRFAGS